MHIEYEPKEQQVNKKKLQNVNSLVLTIEYIKLKLIIHEQLNGIKKSYWSKLTKMFDKALCSCHEVGGKQKSAQIGK